MSLAALLLPASLALGAGGGAGPARRLDPAPLRAAIDDLVQSSALARARVGICVLTLEGGETVYARDPDALLNPASNVKLFTTAAALLRLGPDHRFETEVWVAGGGLPGAVRTLAVRGKGDPSMTGEQLWALAGEIQHRGVQEVRGDLLVDESWFDGEREAPGYEQERGDRPYLAPAGALSLNFNSVAVHVGPGPRVGDTGRVEVEPASDHLLLRNRTATVKPSGRGRVSAHTARAGNREVVVVAGRIPLGSRHQTIWRKVDEPGLYFGETLKRMLAMRGVRVRGSVRRAPVPEGASLLAVAESEPLAEVVRRLNKGSSNFMAEMVLKGLGAEALGAPGSWAKGISAGEEALAALGIPPGSYVWRNGSGLNDTNRFSARQLATLLRELWRRFPLMAEFVGSLPVAGRDGTTRYRMEGTAAEGRLRAKTGTLDGVTSLSGYVETGVGEQLVFALLVNDYAGRAAPVVRAVDGLGELLASAGGAPPPPPALAASDAARSLSARVATYHGLGRAGDRRNLPFLRGALRAEVDPVVRMAVAEAVYLSDPASESGRRAFLDAVVTDRESLARLRELTGDLDLAAPGMGSLADLAAEGVPEAVARFLEVAPAAAGSPSLEGPYAEALEEVARSAPEEVVAALRTAAPEVAEAALLALAPRLGDGGGHPLLESLRAAAGDPDEARAGPARDLSRRLGEIAGTRERRRPAGPEPGRGDDPAAPEPRRGGG